MDSADQLPLAAQKKYLIDPTLELHELEALLEGDFAGTIATLAEVKNETPEGWPMEDQVYDFSKFADALVAYLDGVSFAESLVLLQPISKNTDIFYPTVLGLVHKAVEDPAQRPHATAWLREQEDSELAYAAADTFGRELTELDPAETKKLISDLPSGRTREQVLMSSVEVLIESDVKRAAELVNSVPNSSETNFARSMISERLAPSAPDEAMPWALSVVDPDLRAMAIANVAHSWQQLDEDSLQSWLESAELEESDREMMRQMLGK